MRRRRQTTELNHSASVALAAFLRCAGIVSTTTGVPISAIIERANPWRPRRRRGNAQSWARRATVYLTVTGLNVRQGALARALGRHRSRLLEDIRLIEDAREQPKVDKLFERMEAML